jgi:hypothetical protein
VITLAIRDKLLRAIDRVQLAATHGYELIVQGIQHTCGTQCAYTTSGQGQIDGTPGFSATRAGIATSLKHLHLITAPGAQQR